LIVPNLAWSNEPKPETVKAFEHYRAATEARMDADRGVGHFLYFERYSETRRREIEEQLRRGEFYFEQLHALDQGKHISSPGGLIHHWMGMAFLPKVSLRQIKTVLEDYASEKDNYYPDVRQSRLISQNGNEREVFLQFYSKTIVTAVFNVNFASVTQDYSARQSQVRACSTRVAEVEGFGTPSEHELKPEDSHGYLWGLCTWWHAEEKDGGTYIQVEAIELSRTVPWVFALIVDPIIRNVPRTFLSHLLVGTRQAVNKKQPQY
jgi:hypothetical protein